jgi:2-hydroxy-6-oxonona-2,4-dienedioate hydrolase
MDQPMAELAVNGGTIHYEDRGSGTPIVLTPGGMWGGYVHRVIAAELAKDFRVITWDRRNTDGKSSIFIEGDESEADIWADDLAALIKALRLAPCYLGEYAGCRTSPLMCFKHPTLIKGMMLAFPSGGDVPADRLPRTMYRPYIRAAMRAGMKAVVETKFPVGRDAQFGLPLSQDPDKQNPANHERLLAMKPLHFTRQMAYWESFFTTSADLPIVGCRLSEEEWASIQLPAIITGGADPIHPTDAARKLHRLLPNSVYHEPVVSLEEWNNIFGKVPYPEVADFQGERIAPVWREFVKKMEGRR